MRRPARDDQPQRRAGGDGLAGQPGQRLVADDEQAGGDGGGGRAATSDQRPRSPPAVSGLGPEHLAAAGRAGQHGLPGAVLVLAGEDVAGDDRGQQREHPLGGEAEDQQRQGEAVLGGEPAEQGVLRRPGLAVDDDDDRRPAPARRRAGRPARAVWARSLRTSQRSAAAAAAAASAARLGGRRPGGGGARSVRHRRACRAASRCVGRRRASGAVVGEHEEQRLQRGLGSG